MSSSPSLRDARRRNWQLMNYEDGLWDLLLGLVFMMLAVYPVTRARFGPVANFAGFVGVMMVAVLVHHFVRRQVSTPRVGYVKTKRSRATKLLLVVTTLLVALTAGLAIATLVGHASAPAVPSAPGTATTASHAWARQYLVEIIVMMAVVLLFSVMGYSFGVFRLYLYGWLLGGGFLVSAIVNQNAPDRFDVPLGLAAGIILVIGTALLVRFLRKYPVQSLEA